MNVAERIAEILEQFDEVKAELEKAQKVVELFMTNGWVAMNMPKVREEAKKILEGE